MIKEVLIVEGRADEARIRASKIDVDMIRTDGFNLHPHTLEQIKHAYERRGVIILTDPDSAGERIRSYLAERFPRAKHAFVPREEAIGNNDLGIEQASGEAIRKALSLAKKNDIVLVLGKGHEKTILRGDKAVPFEDIKVTSKLLKEMQK